MATNDPQGQWGRETRLLVLIVVVSLAVLLVLARFQFPAATLDVAPPAPSPLANLAGRAAFQDLADTMVTLFGRVSPRVTVVRLESVPASEPAARAERPGEPPASPRVAYAAALRVGPDQALVHVPDGFQVVAFAGTDEPVSVVATDPTRELALIGISPPADTRSDTVAEGFAGFAYVGVVSATPSGPTIEPYFVGRTGVEPDVRWPAGLVTTGPTGPVAGALIFAVDGRLVGLAVRNVDGYPAIVPPSVIEAVVTALTSAPASEPPAGGSS